MADDFYSQAASHRLTLIEAERAAALADLAAHRANSDYDSAAASVQALANLDAERQNLVSLHQNYIASQTPPTPPEVSPEERAAKPWYRMDYSDVLEMAKGSRYGKDLSWNDKNMQAGYHEAMRRKARGE